MKKFLTATIGAGVLAGAMLMGTGSASAIVTSGQDPLAAGCANDAYTASSWNAYETADRGGKFQATVELRYSPRCGTNWVRVNQTGLSYRTSAGIRASGGASADGAPADSGVASTWWTGMVSAPGATCVTVNFVGGYVYNYSSFRDKTVCG